MRGRESELAALAAGFEAATSQEHAVVLLVGDPGIGKTRLLEQGITTAEARGWSTVVIAPDVDSAFAPLGALVDGATRAVPPLVDAEGLTAAAAGAAPHYWLTRQLSDALEVAAARAGVLIVVDDAQWLDSTSFTVLSSLIAGLEGLPILWLVASRTGSHGAEHDRFLTFLGSVGARADLEPLDRTAVDEIARDALGGRPGPVLERTLQRADGFPLAVIEIIRGLEEEGLLHADAGVLDIAEEIVPARFGASAMERLRLVSREALRLAQVGSLYGREFPLRAVLEIVGLTAIAAAPAIQELIDSGFLVDTGEVLAFRHDSVQFGALESLPPTLKRAMAREVLYSRLRAGERVVDLAATVAAVAGPGEDDSIDLLFTAATQLATTDVQGAADLAVRGARYAQGRSAHAERIAGLMPTILAGGRIEEAMDIGTSVAPLLSPDSHARVSLAIARQLTEFDFDAAIRETTAALDIPGISDATRVQLLAIRALNYANKADPKNLRASLKLARAFADEKRDGLALATIDATESVLFFYQDQFDAARRLQNQAVERAIDAGAVPEFWLPEGLWTAFMRNSLGFCDDALALTEDGLARARQARNVVAEAFWMMVRARALFDAGRMDEARTQAETVLELAALLGLGDFANATAGVVLHRIALQVGDVQLRKTARVLIQKLADGVGLRRTGTWGLAVEAMYLQRPDEAYAHAQLALESLDEPTPSMTTPADFVDDVMLAVMCRNAKDEAGVARVVDVAARRAHRNPSNALVGAIATAVRGIRDRSAEDLFAAVDELERVNRPLVTAGVLEVAGQVEGDIVKATATLERALALYEELGAAHSASRVLHLLRERGVRRRHKPTGGSTTELSIREQQVADRIGVGLTTQQIADDLLVSPHTVVTHIRHIYAKWGINTRREIVDRLAAR